MGLRRGRLDAAPPAGACQPPRAADGAKLLAPCDLTDSQLQLLPSWRHGRKDKLAPQPPTHPPTIHMALWGMLRLCSPRSACPFSR